MREGAEVAIAASAPSRISSGSVNRIRAPVTPGRTLSAAPPSACASTGAPAAIASTGMIPKSSTAGNANSAVRW